MKKRLISVLVVFLIVLSTITFAGENSTSDSCASVWGSIKCFLFGSSENRAGAGWFDRGGEALVGIN